MHQILFFILVFSLFLSIPNIFAEETYVLEIDEHVFDIVYDVDADILAMAIDQELTSLLVGIENSQDSKFTITFPKEMLNAENAGFAVLVNGLEVDYQLSQESNDYTLDFFILSETEEVEIIGTYVIPEFPFGALFGFVLMTSIVLIMSKLRIFK